MWAWGDNEIGQLGDGTTTDRHVPVQVSDLTEVSTISAGYYHSLALKSDGTVWAWGYNEYGELGDNTTTSRFIPGQVSNLTGITAISAGGEHNLALTTHRTVWAWGNNYYGQCNYYYGQLGDGAATIRSVPVQVTGLTGALAIEASEYYSLALVSSSTPSISGNTGTPEAKLNYTIDSARTVKSGSYGEYLFTVPSGWSGTVTPAKEGYSFDPAWREYVNVQSNQPDQNYNSLPAIPVLTSPENAALIGINTPVFTWNGSPVATRYQFR